MSDANGLLIEEPVERLDRGRGHGVTANVLTWTGAVDVGTSGTKSCFFGESPEYPFRTLERFFLVAPHVRALTASSYNEALEEMDDRQGGLAATFISFAHPESGERVFWELGETAARPGLLPVECRKFESCLAKVLGLLGYLVTQELQTTDRIALHLGVLLPLNELDDRHLLSRWLRQTIGDFQFNGVSLRNLSLSSFDCKPEGYGLFRAYGAERVLLVGHRDSTWLCFNGGKLNTKLSRTLPETGMHDFIRSIRFPMTHELLAAQALSLSGRKLKPKPLLELTQTRTAAELEQLQQAIRQAQAQYWMERRSQFNTLSWQEGQVVPVSGGAAHYFSEELNQLFHKTFRVQLHWCEDLHQEFRNRFNVDEENEALLYRFADPYAYARSLPGVERYAVKAVDVIEGGTHG
uniref:Actin-like protein N-terminal domain-containing protein n=1 Tax=Cyanothece sp. (strain PCC 7425 / ATCC 29141) TaxID=395961 RepID=B8HZ00_CYAP4